MSKPSGQPIRPAPRESSGGANMLDQSDHAPDDPGQRLKDRRGGMRAPPPLTGNEQKTWTGRPASKTYPLVFKCQSTGTTLFSHVLVEPGDEHFDSRLPVRCPREHELDGAHFYETRSRRARRSLTWVCSTDFSAAEYGVATCRRRRGWSGRTRSRRTCGWSGRTRSRRT